MDNWVRRNVMSKILDAISAKDESTNVFYITSEGGEGKTVLLRQIGIALGSQDGIEPAYGRNYWSGIIDLYHSDLNTDSGLEKHLAQVLNHNGAFETYLSARQNFDTRSLAGIPAGELEKAREDNQSRLVGCFNSVTLWNRVVVALDTTERIQFEADDIQLKAEIDSLSTSVRAWLINQLQQWRNCVVLLVGRPAARAYLDAALQKGLAGIPNAHYQHITLGGFNLDEARAFFQIQQAQMPDVALDDVFRHELWRVTEGNPIRLSLAMYIMQRNSDWYAFREKVLLNSTADVRRTIDRLMIESIMESTGDDDIRKVLRYLAVARKGLTPALLAYLEDKSGSEDYSERLRRVAELPFVKSRPASPELFMHDEMYRICDAELLDAQEVQETSERIVRWYAMPAQTERAHSGTDDENRVLIDSLLYRLRADMVEGYEWFVRQDDTAIRTAQQDLDMRLHSELVSFMRSDSEIDRRILADHPNICDRCNADFAAAWIKRLLFRGKTADAVAAADRIMHVLTDVIDLTHQEDVHLRLAAAEFEVFFGQALIYAGDVHHAFPHLQKVIDALEHGGAPLAIAMEEGETFLRWRKNLVLGRAHNNLGYAHWTPLDHLGAALRELSAAKTYFEASNDLQEERANTLDNMGRVYCLRRNPTRASTFVQEGLELRRKLGKMYRIALSLNSTAIVHLEFGYAERAERAVREALEICRKLEAYRGIGLAQITLGSALRYLGNVSDYPPEEASQYFAESIKTLKQAKAIFQYPSDSSASDSVKGLCDEPLRYFEAMNELGSTWRDYARFVLRQDDDRLKANALLMDAIEAYQESLVVARDKEMWLQYVDSCEDLAQTCLLMAEIDSDGDWLKQAADWLEQGVSRIDSKYRIRKKSSPFGAIPEDKRVESFWQMLGKVEMTRAELADRHYRRAGGSISRRQWIDELVEHYLLAAAYFEHFSGDAKRLPNTFKTVFDSYKVLSIEDRMEVSRAIKDTAKAYHLEPGRLGAYYADTLGVVAEPVAFR